MAVTSAAKPAAKASAEVKKPAVTQVVTVCDLYDSFLQIRFKSGVPTEVPRVSGWLQAQIDANLASLVN
jgi:hypothetical protein